MINFDNYANQNKTDHNSKLIYKDVMLSNPCFCNDSFVKRRLTDQYHF